MTRPGAAASAAPVLTVGRHVLGPGRPAVIVPVTAEGPEGLDAELRALEGHRLEIVEWRLDRLAPRSDHAAHRAAVVAALPAVRRTLAQVAPGTGLLVTVRTAAEGGARAIAGTALRELCIAVLDAGGADLLDVEVAALGEHLRAVIDRARAAGVPTLASRHDFARTPSRSELLAALNALQETGAEAVKLAVMPRVPGDVLTLLEATATMRSSGAHVPLVTMSMGPLGVVTRLVGARFGSVATFGAVGATSAPGQLPADELSRCLDLLTS